MVTYTQHDVPENVTCDHVVQLFDAPESLGESVAAFLHQGVVDGALLLVVAKPANLQAIGDALTARGLSMARLIEGGQLTVADAHVALHGFMRNGTPHPQLFRETIGRLVGRLHAESSARIRVYGEMVNILAEEGNYRGAGELEELWNALGAHRSFFLLCGYDSAHFAAPDAGDWLRHICSRHTRVHQHHADLLASWLLQGKGLQPVTP
jgi:hypothetical protein